MLNPNKVNRRHDMYIILFGSDQYHPEDHLGRVPDHLQFEYLQEARKAAAEYSNAYIFKLHCLPGDDIPDITRVY